MSSWRTARLSSISRSEKSQRPKTAGEPGNGSAGLGQQPRSAPRPANFRDEGRRACHSSPFHAGPLCSAFSLYLPGSKRLDFPLTHMAYSPRLKSLTGTPRRTAGGECMLPSAWFPRLSRSVRTDSMPSRDGFLADHRQCPVRPVSKGEAQAACPRGGLIPDRCKVVS